MREIKFKAKLKDYSDWVCGYYEKVGGHHFITASDEIAYLIDPNTLCQFITEIDDIEIYEYDCFMLDNADQMYLGFVYFYYENGLLFSQKCFWDFDLNVIIKFNHHIELVKSSLLIKNPIFIGNWHDGEEYLSKQIEKLKKENERN